MADVGEESVTAEQKLEQKHKKERKELQAETARLKHSVPKGDKKRKKEVTVQVAILEAQLEERHTKELEEFGASSSLSNNVSEINTALEGTSIEANGPSDDTVDAASKTKKPSKAQRKREKKAAEGRARADMIANQEVENLTGARNVEAVRIKEILTRRGLAIREVPSDGNCLYAAIELQLKSQDIKTSVSNLRTQCADYMRQAMDDFLPFLSNPNTGEPYSEDDFDKYCKELESTPAWGGQLEINAMSKVLQAPIEVIQADSPSIVSGEEYDSQPLLLTYHRHMFGLGEHYNAVVPKTPEDEEDEFS